MHEVPRYASKNGLSSLAFNACSCQSLQLWDKFLEETDRAQPTKRQLPDALDAWRAWALQQADLSEDEQTLCYGPGLSVQEFDRATIGNSTFACMRVEKAKFSRDSLVLTKSDGKFWAGRVRAFLTHAPPGWEDCSQDDEADIAEVAWFADAVPAEGLNDGLAVDLQCPVFKRAWQDDPTGNLWPIDRLAVCNFATYPHCTHSSDLVVVSRIASSLQEVPAFVGLLTDFPDV